MNAIVTRLLACALLVLAACSGGSLPGTAPASVQCEAPRVTGRLGNALREASGIAPGGNPDLVWLITDDGAPTLFLVDTAGQIRMDFKVQAGKQDWEALASARCGDDTCLYIGDIGDNLRTRETSRVYRLRQPGTERHHGPLPADVFEFRYPDGPHDAEALFVLPGERLFVVTKGRSEPISIYRYPGPLAAGRVVTLELVQQLSESFVQLPDMVTGAGATPDGSWVVLRTYGGVQLYRPRGGQLERVPFEPPVSLQHLHEFQGEGADLRADGTILLSSEKGLDEGDAPLSRFTCRLD